MSAPRVERGKLVWVCTRCADRTEVACDECGTPLSKPRTNGRGFRSWCEPCGVVIRLNETALEQERGVEPKAPAPLPPVAPEPEPAPALAEREEVPDPAPVKSHALEVSVEAARGADYRGADRVVRIVCQPRDVPERDLGSGPLLFTSISGGALFVALLVALPNLFDLSFTGAVGIAGFTSLLLGVIAYARLQKRPTPASALPPTQLSAGPDGLAVERRGAPGWRVEAPRVERVFSVGDRDGVMRVRVTLDDGTQKDLLDGLTEAEAHEVVAQVDRALPGRQAS